MPPRIAVVEDEVAVLEMLCEMLEADGFSVVALDHPDHIQTIESDVPPDLFLIDLMLPGRTGIELAEHLRSAGYTDTPMIAMSASRAMTRYASESGLFQETIYKPFDLSALLQCVERHVP
jgi:CheY-like chemotaxis protein